MTGYNIPSGTVIRLLTDDQLLINVGTGDGIAEGVVFDVLDSRTQNVMDPTTGEDLGSLDLIKAKVRVIKAAPRLSVAEIYPSRISPISITAQVMAGVRPNRLTSDIWPEGVTAGDIVRVEDFS